MDMSSDGNGEGRSGLDGHSLTILNVIDIGFRTRRHPGTACPWRSLAAAKAAPAELSACRLSLLKIFRPDDRHVGNCCGSHGAGHGPIRQSAPG